MQQTVGILAYGSLISDPGIEIKGATVAVRNGVITPFNIEFARSSETRKGGPTLVPVESGGSQVQASIFVLNVPEKEAANMLWRRETRQSDKTLTYKHPKKPGKNRVIVDRIQKFGDVDIVLYTRIGANIENLTTNGLADLAIRSATELEGDTDGISYLKAALENGIKTPLSDAYAAEIMKRLKAKSLSEARANARSAKLSEAKRRSSDSSK